MSPSLQNERDPRRLLAHLDAVERELAALRVTMEHNERLATLGTIAGLIAHEFNNILTPIMSYAQMAQACPKDRDLTAKALQKAVDGSERASQISAAILGFVRMETRDMPVQADAPAARIADVRAAVEETLSCVARDPARDAIQLEVSVPEGCVAAVKPIALQHVLLNLVLNSRNAMIPGGGRLTIRASSAAQPPHVPEEAVTSDAGSTWNLGAISAERNGSGHGPRWVVIQVEDTGNGMPAERLALIFQPFYTSSGGTDRSENSMDTRSERRRGTGLGMTICKRLMDDAGGRIIVESTPGQGTRCTIVLPRAEGGVERMRKSA